jgi:hypothetical protein
VDDEIEAPVGEGGEISHIALDKREAEAMPLRDGSILRQLPRRVVEHGHRRAGGGQDGALLPAARGEAEDVATFQIGEPRSGNRPGGRQDDLPVSASGGGDRLVGDRNRPTVSACHLPVPRCAIVRSYVDFAPSGQCLIPSRLCPTVVDAAAKTRPVSRSTTQLSMLPRIVGVSHSP